jgi:pimeloyl-ACP methyl ester carboxylesterase
MSWEERKIDVDGVAVQLLEAGQGPALLILHDELGHTAWQKWHAELAKHRRLIMPIAPGFRGERLKWMRNVTDLSRFFGRLLREMKLGPVDVVGFSFGGWVAAEMAVNAPSQFRRMALVAPFGIKPSEGVILDMYIVTTAEYLKTSVVDPAHAEEFGALFNAPTPQIIESWEDARIESAQLGWEPYMHNPALAQHVRGLAGLPTLIVWGDKDAILPQSAAKEYAQNIPGAKLEVLHGLGHRPDVEDHAKFADILNRFID